MFLLVLYCHRRHWFGVLCLFYVSLTKIISHSFTRLTHRVWRKNMRTFRLNAVMACLALSLPVYAQQAEQQNKAADTQPASTETEQAASTEQQDLEIIQVKGVKTADLKARDLERMKDGFSSVISTDELGNFVDQNVAESLRRLPGVTLQRSEGEGKFVAVRGLGPSFVTVNMNGRRR